MKLIKSSIKSIQFYAREGYSDIKTFEEVIGSDVYRKKGMTIAGAVNAIITKRLNCDGGNLHIPDYGATIDSCNDSILVYPAWKNIHGVTPIMPTCDGGYRNSLVFYPLKAFLQPK